MGAGLSTSGIRLKCFLNDDKDPNKLRPGDRISGAVRLKVPKRVKNLDKYEGIVLTLVGTEVWMLDGHPVKGYNREGSPLRKVEVERMITDFSCMSVGDGIDFRFPFAMDVPAFPRAQSEGPEEQTRSMSYSSRSTSSERIPTKEVVYDLRIGLKRMSGYQKTNEANHWFDAPQSTPSVQCF